MKKHKRKLFKSLIKLLFFFSIIGILIITGVFAYFAKDLPDPTTIGDRQIIESTKIFDRTGKVIIYDIHGEEKRTVIPFNEIPQYVKDATIAIEDDNFYHHLGIDIRGIVRAAIANFCGNKISQGGSTIGQQYIKNAYLGGPQAQRTYSRKIKEAILTVLLERKYSKDEILEFYLNQIPYGSNAYGIEAASQTFFNKPAKDLTIAESALLAALPQGPSYYSPYGSHIDKLKNRQELVLDKMTNFGYITEEQAQEAKNKELTYASPIGLQAHHFVTMIREYLEEEYGRLYSDINSAGLKVYTTLDWDLQQIAEKVITEGAENNKKSFNATNAALVSIDPKTGQLLALVGSKDYSENQFNVATSPHRQPGSSFKPFAYAAAFSKGFTPETIIFDLETNFGEFGPTGQEKEYIPHNYDLKYRGPVTMRQSLAQSLNIPSVKTLYLAGIDETIDLARNMGITTLQDRGSYGLSLVLGGGEVKLIDEVASYGVFATDGIKHTLNMVLKIEDSEGNVLEEYKDESARVLDEQVARQINDILSDETARAPIMGSYSKLYLQGYPSAAKTGTTQDYTDGWTIGYTPNLVTGVWAGNNEFTQKMRQGAAGLYVAAPIWNDFMLKAYELKLEKQKDIEEDEKKDFEENDFILPKQPEEFISPDPLPTDIKPILQGQLAQSIKIKIDVNTGKLAIDTTPIGQIEEKTYKEVHSILYYVDKNNPRKDKIDNPYIDEQFENWESAVLGWAQNPPCITIPCPVYNQPIPVEYTDSNQENIPLTIKISSPKKDTIIDNNVLTITAQTSLGIKQVDFFFNNQLISSDTTMPYSTTFNIDSYISSEGRYTIKTRAYDDNFNNIEDSIDIYIQK